jgi:FKBP-type peptidyl-prolyl cis-trans isomerase
MIFPAILSLVALQSGQTHSTPPVKSKAAQAATNGASNDFTSAYLPQAPLPTTVLAKVNGTAIRAVDVNKLLWDWAGRGVMEDLILFQLIVDRAKIDKVGVTQAEVQSLFDKQITEIQKQIPGGQDLDTFIREKGFPKSRLYLHIEADALMTKIVDLKFKKTDYINVSTLLVSTKKQPATPPAPGTAPTPPAPPTDEDKQVALGKAMDIYNRLLKGEAWDKVLASSDQSPQTIQTHGTLGWRAIAAFPPKTQTELKGIKVGGFTKPIETQNGLQIFKIDAFGDTAEPTALDGLKKEYEARAKQSLAQELQKGAKIDRLFGQVASTPVPKDTKHLPKLMIMDEKVGTGDTVAAGDEVWVVYTGKFGNGHVFDSNAKPGGMLFHFTVGSHEVIAGWDQGLLGMKKGGKRKLSIPYPLAYGDQGRDAIPPQTDLYFDIELRDVLKKK